MRVHRHPHQKTDTYNIADIQEAYDAIYRVAQVLNRNYADAYRELSDDLHTACRSLGEPFVPVVIMKR